MNGFNYCLSIGNRTEDIIFNYLKGRGHEVISVTDDKEYQKKDIDCLLEHDGVKATLEIKSDTKMHNSGNLFFEEGFDRVSGFRKGWFNYCEADFICFYDGIADCGYMVDFRKAKEIIKAAGRKVSWFNNTDNCTGYAYLLPIGTSKKEGLIAHEFNLKKEVAAND